MPKPSCSDGDFVSLVEKHGVNKAANILGINRRNIQQRRARVERRTGLTITAPESSRYEWGRKKIEHPGAVHIKIENGVVLVGSDSHYWPGIVSTAHRGFVKFCETLKPAAVIKNGDVVDGATISRFAPIGWEKRPALVDELEAAKDRMGEITIAAGKAHRIWPLGNHDGRFETRLAQVAPEYAKIHGVHLKDHFPDWEPCWSVWINDNVLVKHRYRGGIHATRNNILNSGVTMVTGHLHSLKVTPFTDYNGTRWGVDCGTMADPFGPQFNDYLEGNPRDWRSGFAVLTFRDGRLLQPELAMVAEDGLIDFRGDLIGV